MPNQKFISVKLEFIWDRELSVLKKLFDASEKFCSKNTTKIILDYDPVEDDNFKNTIGQIQTTIYNKPLSSLDVCYREMIEEIGENHPVWKHETCIYQLSNYLKKVNEKSKIFTLCKSPNCRCEIKNESECPILDEKGGLITGFHKSLELSPFKIDETEHFELAISNVLDKCLEKL